jgi:hypothetical protein
MFLNGVECEDEVMEMIQENPIEKGRVSRNMKKNEFFLELLHSQRKKWRPHDENALSWSFIIYLCE